MESRKVIILRRLDCFEFGICIQVLGRVSFYLKMKARIPYLFILFFLAGCGSVGIKKPAPLNVILISLDTVAADHLELYGYSRPTMPFLEGFGRENVTFDNASSAAAYTLPSHFSMLTGVSPQTHRLVIDDREGQRTTRQLGNEILTLAEYLATAGYATFWSASLNDQQLSIPAGMARGFGSLHGSHLDILMNGDGDAKDLGELHRFLQLVKTQPSFIFMHTYAAHDPYQPSAKFVARYNVESRKKAIETAAEVRLLKSSGSWSKVHRAWLGQFDLKSSSDVARLCLLYDGGLYALDSKLKLLFELLKQEELFDNSIIIVTSDHGEAFGEHGDFFHRTPFRNQLHVPLIVKVPGTASRRVSVPVFGIDLVPTVLDLVGLAPRANVEGQSLVPLLKGQPFWRKAKYQFALGNDSAAVFDSRWQLISFADNRRKLFDLRSDPKGENDVAERYPNEVLRLESVLSAFSANARN